MEEGEREMLTSAVCSLLEADLLACDALLSLLWTAASSLRHDSLLRPFPAFIPLTSQGDKDIVELVSVGGMVCTYCTFALYLYIL